MDPVAAAHHVAVYRQHLCRILETVVGPVGTSLRLRALGTHRRAVQLRELRDELLAAPAEAEQPSSYPSPYAVEVRACDSPSLDHWSADDTVLIPFNLQLLDRELYSNSPAFFFLILVLLPFYSFFLTLNQFIPFLVFGHWVQKGS